MTALLRTISIAAFLVGGLADPGRAHADLLTYQGARGLAMGGALRAAAVSTPSLYLNPAGIALGRLYHLEAGYQYEGTLRGHFANAAVVDSTNKVAGGLGATYMMADPNDADRTGYDLRLGLGVPLANSLLLGATVKYIHLEQQGASGPGGAAAAANEPLLDDFTFDAGALVRLGPILALGVTGYNLTNLDTPAAPLLLGFGAAASIGQVAVLSADAVLDFTTHDDTTARYGVGAEYFVASRYPLRAGYALDPEEKAQFVSGGLGYVEQRFSLDVALRQQIVGGHDTTVALGLKLFVH